MATNFRHSYRIAILTKYVPCTNFRPSRVKAYTTNGHRLMVSWDDALNADENYLAAAKALAEKMGWDGEWIGGGTDSGYVFVNAPAEPHDSGSYYAKELARIPAGEPVKVVFHSETRETRWLNLNEESARESRAFLKARGF